MELKTQYEHYASDFFAYLTHTFAGSGIVEMLNALAKHRRKVYIFSGIIRDFFLHSNDAPRDLDVVVSGQSIQNVFCDGSITYNQFGGAKVLLNDVTLDIWCLRNTWGIKRQKKRVNANELINTAFFNFSAIAYDYKDKKFVVSPQFDEFLLSEELDYVLSINPLPDLCVVNSLYYSQKLGKKISKRLSKWLRREYHGNLYHDYETVQLRHFGKILYTNSEVQQFVESLNS